ncbi:MAG: DNA-binding protein WhiA, partial [Firmicutes bacterium]|nr:DNA-binding protein WhiA [Bacillota bacterium]
STTIKKVFPTGKLPRLQGGLFCTTNIAVDAALAHRRYNSYGIKKNDTTQVLYYKNSEIISDLLAYLGAPQMALALHSLTVERETERRMRRIANCDEANINKIVTLARSHIAAIEKLEKTNKLERLPQKLLETAVLRKENPELSIEELALLAGISKSGMRHRLDKLMEIAQG